MPSHWWLLRFTCYQLTLLCQCCQIYKLLSTHWQLLQFTYYQNRKVPAVTWWAIWDSSKIGSLMEFFFGQQTIFSNPSNQELLIELQVNWFSHLGVHKHMNACWSMPRSQTAFCHFKIFRKWEIWSLCGRPLWLTSFIPAPGPKKQTRRVRIITSYWIESQLLLAALQL